MKIYRKLRYWKYELTERYRRRLRFPVDADVVHGWIRLTGDGDDHAIIDVKKGYAWDGPSGPTIDTENFILGSLAHDAIYQLIREGYLTTDRRGDADDVLRDLCREAGMSRFRSWYVWRAVRIFGRFAVRKKTR